MKPSRIKTNNKPAFKKLNAKDMVLPGGKQPSLEQLEEFLDREDVISITIHEVRKKLQKRYRKSNNTD